MANQKKKEKKKKWPKQWTNNYPVIISILNSPRIIQLSDMMALGKTQNCKKNYVSLIKMQNYESFIYAYGQERVSLEIMGNK